MSLDSMLGLQEALDVDGGIRSLIGPRNKVDKCKGTGKWVAASVWRIVLTDCVTSICCPLSCEKGGLEELCCSQSSAWQVLW